MQNLLKRLVILAVLITPACSSAEDSSYQIGRHTEPLPLWYDKDGYTDAGKTALNILNEADKHGIDTQRYLANIPATNSKPDDLNQIQLANEGITQSMTQYLLDLRYGVTKSANIIAKLSTDEQQLQQEYLHSTLNLIADSDDDYEEIIGNFTSKNKEYKKLKSALSFYKKATAQELLQPVSIGKSLRENDSSPQIAKIRHNLQVISFLRKKEIPEAIAPNPSEVYDHELFEQVIAFQQEHGLESSGAIGKQTADAINQYSTNAIDQIALSMEKIRANENIHHDKYIIVNIPEYKLYAYEDGKLKFSMPVIVGNRANPTPEFSQGINMIVVNPDWNPTNKITRNELLPKIRENPEFLTQSGYEVKWIDTNEVIPQDDYQNVDWENIDVSHIKIRQPSGRSNALGNIKFLMPQTDDIYLHDTNNRKLFENSYRALSHGCIRLGEPMKLAEFVLGADEYKKQNIEGLAGRAGSRYIEVDSFPVYVTYRTASIDDSKIKLSSDVYNKADSYKKLAAQAMQPKLISAVSPTYPSSYWANIYVDEIAFAVKPNAP